MYIIAENIQILATRVKQAIADRDDGYFRDTIAQLAEAGASAIDLNIGPSKRSGHEILPWLVKEAEKVTDLPLCFDTGDSDRYGGGVELCRTALYSGQKCCRSGIGGQVDRHDF